MQVLPLLSSVLPKAFPIKASDYSLMWIGSELSTTRQLNLRIT
jgi:hypothetical protein